MLFDPGHPSSAQSQIFRDSITMAAVSIYCSLFVILANLTVFLSPFPPLRRARSSEVSTSLPPIRISEVSVLMWTLYSLAVPLKDL